MTIKRREFNKILGVAAITPAWFTERVGATPVWSLAANISECCSCTIPCPCNFGRPTSLRCDGNRLIEIYEGHVDDADLTGIRFLVTFEMGKWSRIYVDENLNDDQMNAYDTIMPLAFNYFVQLSLSAERAPLTVARTNNLIKFSVPASEVEMKPLVGLDGGPISINGLPSNAFHNYVQYESVKHIHKGPGRKWSHSGTNGFISKMLASS